MNKTTLRKQLTFGNATTDFSVKDVLQTGAEIPYWWRVTTQIWVVFLIGWSKFPAQHVQSEALPRFGQWRVISMEFLHLFLRRHFAGKLVVGSRKVCCFLRIDYYLHFTNLWFPVINSFFPFIVWSLHLSTANFLEVERLVECLSTDVKKQIWKINKFFKKSNSYFVFIVLTTLLSKPEVCLLLFRLNHRECMVWSLVSMGER